MAHEHSTEPSDSSPSRPLASDAMLVDHAALADPARNRGLRNFSLIATMVSSTFLIFVMSVLASTFIDAFGLTRFQLGMIGSLNVAVGAATAPATGRLTDRIGARQACLATQLLAAFGLALIALSGSVLVLIVASAILGIPQGWGNPATNALIAERVEPGRRGTITGIKQSGVTFGAFLAGMTLPRLTNQFDWRTAVGVYAGLFALSALITTRMPARVRDVAMSNEQSASDDARTYNVRAIRLIAIYAFLMGTAGGAIGRFLVLFAEEEAGMTGTTAGLVFAITGLGGMLSRVVAGHLAEHVIAPLKLLAMLAVIGSGVSVLLLATLSVGAWVLWFAAVLYAIGHTAWNAVAMLAIILDVPKAQAGRASGTTMVGFLGGLAVGAPVAGLLIDATDSYQPVWAGTLALAVAAAIVAQFAQRARPIS